MCNPCHWLNWSCIWRQDNKKNCTCYFCQRGKISCSVDPAYAEAGPSKKVRLAKGKEKAWETEPEMEDEVVTGPLVRERILAGLLGEQRLYNTKLLGEISQICRALFQMGKMLKGLAHNTNDIVDHVLSKEDDNGRRIVGGAIINVDEEQGVEVKAGKEAEGENGAEVEGEKEAEVADGADETLP